jgi:hypothetical protein
VVPHEHWCVLKDLVQSPYVPRVNRQGMVSLKFTIIKDEDETSFQHCP